MAASILLLLVFNFLILAVHFSSVASQYEAYICYENGNYTSESIYRANLNTLLGSLSSKINNTGFYSESVGQVNAIALCRADIQPEACRGCVDIVARDILQLCPTQFQAIRWSEFCIVRYSNDTIFGTLSVQNNRAIALLNTNNVTTNLNKFKEERGDLMDELRGQAANSLRKAAAGDQSGVDLPRIYAMVQCMPDLSPDDCESCLVQAAGFFPQCCDASIGARIYTPSCIVRYENVSFYNITRLQEPLTPPSSPSPPSSGKNETTRNVIIIVISIVSSVTLALCVAIFARKRMIQKQKKYHGQIFLGEAVDEISTVESIQYDFGTIRASTNDFSDANRLGQGGFGAVYKGELPNGQEIAVKRLSRDSGQGDMEFKNEVLLLAKLQHRNLVRLMGFSLEGTERLLVYELVRNGSLDRFLFDSKKQTDLSWDTRYNIIKGIAKGLLYLHEDSRLRIIHRDLKAGNVLLGEDMTPKIADFGMARLVVSDETKGSTNRIVGTYGYMAPEYATYGHFSVKSDVFSFGVLVLEIIIGQRRKFLPHVSNSEDPISFAWRNWRDGTTANIIDPILRASFGVQPEMLRCIHIGLLCVQENAVDRPTMASVVLMLNSSSLTLKVPSQPAFYDPSGILESSERNSFSEASLLREQTRSTEMESGTSLKSGYESKSSEDISIINLSS